MSLTDSWAVAIVKTSKASPDVHAPHGEADPVNTLGIVMATAFLVVSPANALLLKFYHQIYVPLRALEAK